MHLTLLISSLRMLWIRSKSMKKYYWKSNLLFFDLFHLTFECQMKSTWKKVLKLKFRTSVKMRLTLHISNNLMISTWLRAKWSKDFRRTDRFMRFRTVCQKIYSILIWRFIKNLPLSIKWIICEATLRPSRGSKSRTKTYAAPCSTLFAFLLLNDLNLTQTHFTCVL